MDFGDIALRLGVATLIGGLIGMDRYAHHKSIGVRTLGLVALGSASLVTASLAVTGPAFDASGASRIIQGLITGIGFIGAGVIMRSETNHKVHGLTTAATAWIAAIAGVICGLGAWPVAILMSGLIALLLLAGGRLEKWLTRHDPAGEDGARPRD